MLSWPLYKRAENRLPALPERGPPLARRAANGASPHIDTCHWPGVMHGREPALAAIACEKSDLVHVPPGLVHVRGGVKKSIFFNELVPPGRIEGITGAPWRVLPPPVPSEGGVPKSPSSGHVQQGMRYITDHNSLTTAEAARTCRCPWRVIGDDLISVCSYL